MKKVTLKISDIARLDKIQIALKSHKGLSKNDKMYLVDCLSKLPTISELLIDQIPFEEQLMIELWDIKKIMPVLGQWQILFENIPGFDFAPACYLFEVLDENLLKQNVIACVVFAPTMAYNAINLNEGYEIHLKGDGSAKFNFPKFEDAEAYPELYNFKGTWKEAYYLLIETLKKGWPMEEFPEELLPFLKK